MDGDARKRQALLASIELSFLLLAQGDHGVLVLACPHYSRLQVTRRGGVHEPCRTACRKPRGSGTCCSVDRASILLRCRGLGCDMHAAESSKVHLVAQGSQQHLAQYVPLLRVLRVSGITAPAAVAEQGFQGLGFEIVVVVLPSNSRSSEGNLSAGRSLYSEPRQIVLSLDSRKSDDDNDDDDDDHDDDDHHRHHRHHRHDNTRCRHQTKKLKVIFYYSPRSVRSTDSLRPSGCLKES